MDRSGGKCLAAVLLAFGCRHADAVAVVAAREEPEVAVSAVDRAALLQSELAQGRMPGGVETTLNELAAEAAAHAEPQRSDTLLAAGDLLAARYRLARLPGDLARAKGLYEGVSREPGPRGCVGLGRTVALLTVSGDARQTMAAREALSARCGAPRETIAVRVEPAVPTVARAAVQRVVLDPGHGGNDPGAIGPTGLTEASVNLDVARRVADRLSTTYGVQVVLTRDTDVYVDLEDRAAQANASGADLFVSIHCNASANTEARGISTFVLETTSDRINNRVVAREGELVGDDPMASADLPRILANLRLSSQGNLSFALASRMQDAMLHDARIFHAEVLDMGVHPARFQVLVTARMPAVLVELSFISNAVEEQRLRSDSYRDLLASALARAIATP